MTRLRKSVTVEEYLGSGRLGQAADAFMAIHDKMWEINGLCSETNADKLKERETRLKIVDIIKKCETLEEQAAEWIGTVLKL